MKRNASERVRKNQLQARFFCRRFSSASNTRRLANHSLSLRAVIKRFQPDEHHNPRFTHTHSRLILFVVLHRHDLFQPHELPSQTSPVMATIVEKIKLGDIIHSRPTHNAFHYSRTTILTVYITNACIPINSPRLHSHKPALLASQASCIAHFTISPGWTCTANFTISTWLLDFYRKLRHITLPVPRRLSFLATFHGSWLF